MYYWHQSEKLHFEPSQIATVTNCDNSGIPAVATCELSQFVIKAMTAQTESNNTENVFWVLRIVPRFTFDMNMKSCIFAHFVVFSMVYLFVCISDIMPIIDVPRKPSGKDPMSMWTCFLYLGIYPRFLWNQSEKLCFEPAQIATVTNWDKAGIPAVAICDLSQCFWLFWCYFTGTSVCVYVYQLWSPWSMYPGNHLDRIRCWCELFSALRSIPLGTIDINLRSCVLNRHKLRQSQIAKKQESLPPQFVICRNLWQSQFRGKFSPITLKMCSAYLGEYPCSFLTGIWEIEFSPISVLFAICIVYNSPNMRYRNEPKECV